MNHYTRIFIYYSFQYVPQVMIIFTPDSPNNMLRVRCEVSVTLWLWGQDLSPKCRKRECVCTSLLCSLNNGQILPTGMAPGVCFDFFIFLIFFTSKLKQIAQCPSLLEELFPYLHVRCETKPGVSTHRKIPSTGKIWGRSLMMTAKRFHWKHWTLLLSCHLSFLLS